MAKTKCAVCSKDADLRCSRCKQVWYCGKEHQVQDWKQGDHKKVCNDHFKADQLTLHKQEFDRITKKYKLDEDAKATEISQLLTSGQKITAPDFAEKFGMDMQEAVVFLEWIQVGVRFKEQTIDTAKKAGFTAPK